MKSTARPTISDVSQRAGVSTATVSRMINGIGRISEETRARVEKAIEELGYETPAQRRAQHHDPVNGMGAGFGSKRPLLFLRMEKFTSTNSPTTALLTEALHQITQMHGRSLVVQNVSAFSSDTPLSALLENAEGVIIRIPNDVNITPEMHKWVEGVPCVQILGNNRFDDLWVDHVTPSNQQVGLVAARYLINQGCKQLIMVIPRVVVGIGIVRCLSFVQLAKEAGVEVKVLMRENNKIGQQEKLIHHLDGMDTPYFMAQTSQELAQHMKDSVTSPFGLFVPTCFELALFQPLLQMAGLEFGKKNFAVGCDLDLRSVESLTPAPATIDLHLEHIALLAVRRLLCRIEHSEEPLSRIQVSPDIVPAEDVARSSENVSLTGTPGN